MPHEQQPALIAHDRHLLHRVGAVEATGQRREHRQPGAVRLVPQLGGELRRLVGADLGAVENGLKTQSEACEGQAGHPGLPFAPLGQAPLRILAASVRLGVCVTK